MFLELFSGSGVLTPHVKKLKGQKVITISTDLHLVGIDFRDRGSIGALKSKLLQFQDDEQCRLVFLSRTSLSTFQKPEIAHANTRARPRPFSHVMGSDLGCVCVWCWGAGRCT